MSRNDCDWCMSNIREEGRGVKLYSVLAPLAWLYKIAVWFRNRMFDWKILPSESFDVPIVSVGNITVGGTGKTPHTEYLVRLFSDASYRVAVLSRGYKRHTHGFRIVSMSSTAAEVGDEPLQIKRKFPTVTVAVDVNRRHGIRKLLSQVSGIDVVLLDDAYQHRYVTPAFSILLVNHERMIYEDKMLPVGRLREPESEKSRANIVIVTKCPDSLKPIDFRLISKHLNLYPYQSIYFSGLHYGRLSPVFASECKTILAIEELSALSDEILLVAGVASPDLFEQYIGKYAQNTLLWTYHDHHEFSSRELRKMNDWVAASLEKGESGVVIVTEKDAVRIIDNPNVPELLKQHLYYLPMKVRFMQDQGASFDMLVKELVEHYRRSVIQRK